MSGKEALEVTWPSWGGSGVAVGLGGFGVAVGLGGFGVGSVPCARAGSAAACGPTRAGTSSVNTNKSESTARVAERDIMPPCLQKPDPEVWGRDMTMSSNTVQPLVGTGGRNSQRATHDAGRERRDARRGPTP